VFQMFLPVERSLVIVAALHGDFRRSYWKFAARAAGQGRDRGLGRSEFRVDQLGLISHREKWPIHRPVLDGQATTETSLARLQTDRLDCYVMARLRSR
jgi:hypothetical protein